MTIGQILPGTQLWRVESGPVSLAEAAQWDLRGEGGRQSMLAIKQLYDTGALIDQTELSATRSGFSSAQTFRSQSIRRMTRQ
jgi:hypothetical protein